MRQQHRREFEHTQREFVRRKDGPRPPGRHAPVQHSRLRRNYKNVVALLLIGQDRLGQDRAFRLPQVLFVQLADQPV